MAADSTGIHISQEKALAAYTGLGENWWKQLFDGKYHIHGPMVFDEGLHTPQIKEPGFYASACKAHAFVQEHLCEPLSVAFYLDLHKIACAHFEGAKNNTAITADKTGAFRFREKVHTTPSIHMILKLFAKKEKFSDQMLSDYIEKWRGLWSQIEPTMKSRTDKLDRIYKKTLLEMQKEKNKLNVLLGYPAEEIGPHSLLVYHSGDKLIFQYPHSELWFSRYKPLDIESAVEKLFNKFNEDIAAAYRDIEDHCTLEEKKITLIAEFFQLLEWLHPFQDGQGRTDLLLLAKLLSEHGLHPAILEEPYYSTFAPLSMWINYLKKGMRAWEMAKVCP